jgi:transposase
MLSLPSAVRIFVCLAPVDMRRSFDGLSALAEQVAGASPLSGHLFVFGGRRGDRVKILYWDRDGYALWYKRLETGAFRFPAGDGASRELSAADLMLLLEGIDVAGVKRSKRFAVRREHERKPP